MWLCVDMGNVGLVLIDCSLVFKVGLLENVEGVNVFFGVNSMGVNEYVIVEIVWFGFY